MLSVSGEPAVYASSTNRMVRRDARSIIRSSSEMKGLCGVGTGSKRRTGWRGPSNEGEWDESSRCLEPGETGRTKASVGGVRTSAEVKVDGEVILPHS